MGGGMGVGVVRWNERAGRKGRRRCFGWRARRMCGRRMGGCFGRGVCMILCGIGRLGWGRGGGEFSVAFFSGMCCFGGERSCSVRGRC